MRANKTWLLSAGLVTGVVGLLWLNRRLGLSSASWRQVWRQTLAQRHGEAAARQVMARVEARYAALKAQRPLPAHPALRWHVAENMLPGLALYQVRLEAAPDRQTALAEVEALFRVLILHRRRLPMELLRRAPFKFELFRLAFRHVMRQFPAEGWDMTSKERSGQRIAFDIHRCFYLDTLTAYGAPELTALFCQADDTLAEMLPPAIRFERSTTLARGGPVCDFSYARAAGLPVKAPARLQP